MHRSDNLDDVVRYAKKHGAEAAAKKFGYTVKAVQDLLKGIV